MGITLNESVNLFSAAGLTLDFVGVLLLFKYGLPSKAEEDVMLLDVGNRDEENSRRIAEKNRRIYFRSYLGLALVAFGFFLQLLGVFFKTL